MKNKMISFSKKGVHIYGSKQGFSTRIAAEATIETNNILKNI